MKINPFLVLLIIIFSATCGDAKTWHVGSQNPCLEKHMPNADVAYKPGVDAHDNAVKPADLNAAPLSGFGADDVKIQMDLPLQPHVSNPDAYKADLSEARIHLDEMKLEKDGGVSLGGKSLNGAEGCGN